MWNLKYVTVLAGAVLLVGCASVPAAVSPDASSEKASPSMEESPSSPSGPVSRLGLTCTDVLPADLVASAVQEGMVTTDLMADPPSATPLGYAVSRLGGVSCLSSVAVSTPAGSPETGNSSVSVQVLPDASAPWADYAEQDPTVVTGRDAPYGDASTLSCFGAGAESSCSVNILAGDNWIAIVADGISVDASLSDDAVGEHIAPLITDIVATVSGAPAPAPAWVAPAATASLPADCTAYATADEFRALFGTVEEISIGSDRQGEAGRIDAAAWTQAGVDRCTWVPENTGQTWQLLVTALPGGEWAYDRSSALMTSDGFVEAVPETITGVDRAAFGCHVYSGFCTLDTVIGGNWVQFNAEAARLGTPDTARARLIEIAASAAG